MWFAVIGRYRHFRGTFCFYLQPKYAVCMVLQPRRLDRIMEFCTNLFVVFTSLSACRLAGMVTYDLCYFCKIKKGSGTHRVTQNSAGGGGC